MENKNDARISHQKITQLSILAVIIFIGWILSKEMLPYLSSILGAIALYEILIQPMHNLHLSKKWPSWIAALILMVVSFIVMVIPFVYLTTIIVDTIAPYIDDPSPLKEALNKINDFVIQTLNVDIVKPDTLTKLSEEILPFAQKTLGSTFLAVGNVFLMYLVLYFMLVNSATIEIWLRQHLPFKEKNVNKILTEFKSLVYSNAVGIPLVALSQGIAAFIGYWIFGVDNFMLMALLTAIASVIPLVGTLIIYLPLAIYQFSIGDVWGGAGVALWGFLIIGSIDNFARFMIQKKLANIHPLITLFGVLIGVNLMGFLGVIFGPLMISLLFLLLNIYQSEYGSQRTST